LPLQPTPSGLADLDALCVPSHLRHFGADAPSIAARLQAVVPNNYARSRNALDGAVTGLSPYLTHGMLSVTDAARAVHARYPLSFEDKLVFEFGWREFFAHVWQNAAQNGDAVLQDLGGSAPWSGHYAASLPDDIRQARSGVPAIDNAVRILYATGYLHNHIRMWLASYVVHVRKVDWRVGADWLYAHLLDGDLASNHLSWQWVTGTFSSKPYLFNAENVRKYAPSNAQAAWDSSGTAIDISYEAMDILARQRPGRGAEFGPREGVQEPALYASPDSAWLVQDGQQSAQQVIDAIDGNSGKVLALIHPWSLSPRKGNALRLGVIDLPAHALLPWSAKRWQFVLAAMAQVTDAIWIGDLSTLRLPLGSVVQAQATQFPHYREALADLASLTAVPRLLPEPNMACRSFSKFYERSRRGVDDFSSLL
jgi:deoxyribodipyrimidine photo-lyase